MNFWSFDGDGNPIPMGKIIQVSPNCWLTWSQVDLNIHSVCLQEHCMCLHFCTEYTDCPTAYRCTCQPRGSYNLCAHICNVLESQGNADIDWEPRRVYMSHLKSKLFLLLAYCDWFVPEETSFVMSNFLDHLINVVEKEKSLNSLNENPLDKPFNNLACNFIDKSFQSFEDNLIESSYSFDDNFIEEIKIQPKKKPRLSPIDEGKPILASNIQGKEKRSHISVNKVIKRENFAPKDSQMQHYNQSEAIKFMLQKSEVADSGISIREAVSSRPRTSQIKQMRYTTVKTEPHENSISSKDQSFIHGHQVSYSNKGMSSRHASLVEKLEVYPDIVPMIMGDCFKSPVAETNSKIMDYHDSISDDADFDMHNIDPPVGNNSTTNPCLKKLQEMSGVTVIVKNVQPNKPKSSTSESASSFSSANFISNQRLVSSENIPMKFVSSSSSSNTSSSPLKSIQKKKIWAKKESTYQQKPFNKQQKPYVTICNKQTEVPLNSFSLVSSQLSPAESSQPKKFTDTSQENATSPCLLSPFHNSPESSSLDGIRDEINKSNPCESNSSQNGASTITSTQYMKLEETKIVMETKMEEFSKVKSPDNRDVENFVSREKQQFGSCAVYDVD